ncbi:histone H1.0-like [Hydra vulgaris]|uniref:histone H1.0-like n=1 Tax=Hydra vulgaris TaxID=6087 RepID=UPI0032EA2C68
MSQHLSPKKVAKKKAVKKPTHHAPYNDMIIDAIKSLKERKGSSRQAITKHVKAHNKVGENVDLQVKMNLKRMVANKTLVQMKGTGASGSFRIGAKKVVKKRRSISKKTKRKSPKKKSASAKKLTPKKKTKKTKKIVKKSPKKRSSAKKHRDKKVKKSPKKLPKKSPKRKLAA